MVYEWGSLPTEGYWEEVPDQDEEAKVGDYIKYDNEFIIASPTALGIGVLNPWFITEKGFGEKMRQGIAKKGHECTYMKVDIDAIDLGLNWIYRTEYVVHIKHASPFALSTLIVIALLLLFAISISPALNVVIMRLAGVPTEEIPTIIGLGIGMIFLLLIGFVAVLYFLGRKT